MSCICKVLYGSGSFAYNAALYTIKKQHLSSSTVYQTNILFIGHCRAIPKLYLTYT